MELCATCFFSAYIKCIDNIFLQIATFSMQIAIIRFSTIALLFYSFCLSTQRAHCPPQTNTFAPSAILFFFSFCATSCSPRSLLLRNINFPLYPNCHSYTSVNQLHLLLSLITSQHAWQAHTQVKVHRSASSADSCVSAH